MNTLGAICEALNQPLVLREMDLGELKEDEVWIRIHYAALNHRDVWIQKGQYAAIKLPVIPGSDGAGIVMQKGKAVSNCTEGDEVILQPGFEWGNDDRFQSKAYHILGMPHHGTFAHYLKINAAQVYAKPRNLNLKEAAALPLAGLTAFRALFTRAKCKDGDKVLVTGAGGGVALFVIQFAIAAGCEVWVTSGDEEKISKAKALGAKGGINYKTENWHKELLKMAGEFDIIIDSAAGDNFPKLTDLCTSGGTIAIYGGTLGEINRLQPARIFWRQINVCGSTMGTPAEFADMLRFVEEKKIVPVCAKEFALADINEAFRYMDEGKQFGKIVVNCTD